MCDIVWASRMELEFKERIKALYLGKYSAKLFLKFFNPLQILLLSLQVVYGLLKNDLPSCVGEFMAFESFFSIMILGIVILLNIFCFFVDGSKSFYKTGIMKIRRAKKNHELYQTLKKDLKEGKQIHFKCIVDIVSKHVLVIAWLVFMVSLQSILWINF